MNIVSLVQTIIREPLNDGFLKSLLLNVKIRQAKADGNGSSSYQQIKSFVEALLNILYIFEITLIQHEKQI